MTSSESLLCVGQIGTTHGLRGDVNVKARTDFPEVRFAKGKSLFVQDSSGAISSLTVESARPHKNAYLVRFREWNRIEEAEPFKGSLLYVRREDTVDSGVDEYYFHEIVGCQVETLTGEPVGTVKEILPLGANDVWVIRRDHDSDLLIPFIEEIVKEVDIAKQIVRIKWMEGLGE
ncbi:ribosome maturation factor RimM [Mechercharimyces sp. CAU 1602]|uniref:ribosome maturation factor RimM n=1 Tax=Mechercharimyces sp. CAU 1602 TaxID=2973933 RepID=UPI002161B419|nr:ribosome maturation factor RimM [Mechercharimyces sp. CAU 1602]MCS1351355.1 ribosome maturation factor RimM [Mechercharimyces sp. CAU 1602]